MLLGVTGEPRYNGLASCVGAIRCVLRS